MPPHIPDKDARIHLYFTNSFYNELERRRRQIVGPPPIGVFIEDELRRVWGMPAYNVAVGFVKPEDAE